MEKAIVNSAGLSIDDQLSKLKLKQSNIGKLFDIEIKKLELEKNTVQEAQNEISSKEKEGKIREDLVKRAMAAKSSAMSGNNVDQMIPVEPEAQGMPLLAMSKAGK